MNGISINPRFTIENFPILINEANEQNINVTRGLNDHARQPV
jgi:hypothetical protein